MLRRRLDQAKDGAEQRWPGRPHRVEVPGSGKQTSTARSRRRRAGRGRPSAARTCNRPAGTRVRRRIGKDRSMRAMHPDDPQGRWKREKPLQSPGAHQRPGRGAVPAAASALQQAEAAVRSEIVARLMSDGTARTGPHVGIRGDSRADGGCRLPSDGLAPATRAGRRYGCRSIGSRSRGQPVEPRPSLAFREPLRSLWLDALRAAFRAHLGS